MTSIVLFRQNLRLKDNPVLALASTLNQPVIPLVIVQKKAWQKAWFSYPSMGPFREQFYWECLLGLDHAIGSMGGQLWVSLDDVEATLHAMINQITITHVVSTKEVGHYESQFEGTVLQVCEAAKVPITFIWDNTLIHPKNLPFDPAHVPNSFSAFRKKIEENPIKLEDEYPSNCLFYTGKNLYPLSEAVSGVSMPKLVGENAAWQHVNDYIWGSTAIAHYKETRNFSLGHHISTKFSCWLSMGVLSSRQLLREIRLFEKKIKKNTSTYWVFFELLWRDFFHYQCQKQGVKWYSYNGIRDQNAPVPIHDDKIFQTWVFGETSQPFVNSHMKELRKTGYMSNRGRQVVASYLVHDLGLDWRRGAEVFEHFLIDYDVASNIGNWQYIAGVGNSETKRVFNIKNQQKKYDPGNKHVEKWLGKRSD